jgi:predicted nucleic acid-binding protein
MKPCFLDTGPIVALLDRADPRHEWIVPRFYNFVGRLVTTGAVVTEAMSFLQARVFTRADAPGCRRRR